MKYHIVADRFSRIRIRSHNNTVYPVTPEERTYLEGFIEARTQEAKETGSVFYDGELIGVNMKSFIADGNEVSFNTQAMTYSQHAGLFRTRHDALVQAMYVNGILITRDNRIVFGLTQATEKDWMNRYGVPAGALEMSPDGFPSLGAQIYREIGEELGLALDHHAKEIILGWINGMSRREGNYHLTTSFVIPLNLATTEMRQWFDDWSHAQGNLGRTTEFADLRFVPNDPIYVQAAIESNCNGRLLGKTADIIEEWATVYKCDPEKLKDSKKGASVYLPQPVI